MIIFIFKSIKYILLHLFFLYDILEDIFISICKMFWNVKLLK